MQPYSIGYAASVPYEKGFRWLRKSKGEWTLDDEPSRSSEWPESCAGPKRKRARQGGSRRGRLYLAADGFDIIEPAWGYVRGYSKGIGPTSAFISEPDLYLKFASLDPTPDAIAAFAERYGFLHAQQSETWQMPYVELDCERHPEITRAFASDQESLVLYIEPASAWVGLHRSIRWIIEKWSEANIVSDSKARIFVVEAFGNPNPAKLDFRLRLDFASQRLTGEIVAATLSDFLHLQFGMAMAQEVEHRQCGECARWFSVGGSSAKPEKTYCSDACRMRAYRKRKAGKK